MPLIRETIVITASRDGRAHLAPIGLIAEVDDWIIAPFRPSTTLDNLRAVPFATASNTDDVRVFAGCLYRFVRVADRCGEGGARASSCRRALAHRTRRH